MLTRLRARTPACNVRRWKLSQSGRPFEIDPLACPTCRGPLRIIAFVTQASVPAQILTHLCSRASRAAHAGAQSPPMDAGSREPGRVTRPTPLRGRPDRTPEDGAPPPDAPRGAPRDHAGTFSVRGRPTAAAPRAPSAPGHPPGPTGERRARHTGAVAGAPSPSHRCSRGRAPGPTFSPPRGPAPPI